MTERVLIVDFGAQYTQLIARRVREAGVYCEILPCTVDDERIRSFGAKAIILSGGPASTTEADAPRAPEAVYEIGVPLLGICYGEQTICAQLGGKVEIACVIDASGAISSSKVRKSSGNSSLDQAALKAVRKWKFNPAVRGGKKVKATCVVPFNFEIKR